MSTNCSLNKSRAEIIAARKECTHFRDPEWKPRSHPDRPCCNRLSEAIRVHAEVLMLWLMEQSRRGSEES